jgi:Tfp pilus assembly protein PilP
MSQGFLDMAILRELDWHKPWSWPRPCQQSVKWLGVIVGIGLLMPHCCLEWQAWRDARDLQTTLSEQQHNTHELQMATTALERTNSTSGLLWGDVSALTDRTSSAGLIWVQQSMGVAKLTPSLAALQLQQTPVQLQARGAWHAWLDWLTNLPQRQPGAVVQSLTLELDLHQGIRAEMTLLAPQQTKRLTQVTADSQGDPFNAERWVEAQQQRTQQHASYNARVAPELRRSREVLERFPIESLHYVGHLSKGADIQALVRVETAEPVQSRTSSAMAPIHRVRKGSYLGQHFGRVSAITANELQMTELVLAPSGEWQYRDLRLLLSVREP